jgi:hypothetical protein
MLPVELNTYQSTDKAFTAGGGIDLSVALPAIVQGTRSFYFWPEAYLPNLLKKVQLVFLAGSALACFLLPRPWWDKAAALVLLGAACFAPRSLQSLHADGWYHQLALTAYALVIAAAVLLVMRAAPVLIRNGAALLAGLLIAAYVAQCNWISTVNHLNTMAHFTTMTQVLARLRGLPSTDWDGRTIAVVGEYDMGNAYPYKRSTGVASEFLRARHMEKLAKLMRDEARFINANVTMPSIMKFAAARPIWPHPASVGVVNGVGVVVLSKDGAGVGQ